MGDWLNEMLTGQSAVLRDAAGRSLEDRQMAARNAGLPEWSDHLTTGRLHSDRLDKELGGYDGIAQFLATPGPGITVEKGSFEKYAEKLRKQFGDTIETIPGKLKDGTEVFHLRRPPPVW
jgi:hypothetical protein